MHVVLLQDVTNPDRVQRFLLLLLLFFRPFFFFLVCAAARDGKRRTDRETFPENYRARKLLI